MKRASRLNALNGLALAALGLLTLLGVIKSATQIQVIA